MRTAAALIIIGSSVLPLLRSQDWWIRWFDFPRLQLMIIGLVLLGLHLLRGAIWHGPGVILFTALLLSVGYQAWRIFPYTPLSREQVKSSVASDRNIVVRVVTANVLMNNRGADKYLKVLAEVDPDIIFTTEADEWWTEQLKALDRSHPHHVKYPLGNTYGMILHSRLPLVEPSVRFLVEPMIPSIHCDILLPGDNRLRFIGLHPRPPGPTENVESTERDAELIIVAKSIKESNQPVLILGDLNDVAWSHTTTLFQRISGLLDPRIGRGMFNSYHADYFFLRFPLDHIFHSGHFKLIELSRLAHIGSDHFPIYAALSFHPKKDAAGKLPAPQPEEKKEAEKTVEKAKEKKR
jgi:endonuclease/exonuclease/phosphatase (EEP) superfamily protein YafD